MKELKEWIEAQFSDRQVEPNSNLGKALRYWLSHWEELTVWLREPGTPLDNNESERALKQFILMRKNSLFFKSEHLISPLPFGLLPRVQRLKPIVHHNHMPTGARRTVAPDRGCDMV